MEHVHWSPTLDSFFMIAVQQSLYDWKLVSCKIQKFVRCLCPLPSYLDESIFTPGLCRAHWALTDAAAIRRRLDTCRSANIANCLDVSSYVIDDSKESWSAETIASLPMAEAPDPTFVIPSIHRQRINQQTADIWEGVARRFDEDGEKNHPVMCTASISSKDKAPLIHNRKELDTASFEKCRPTRSSATGSPSLSSDPSEGAPSTLETVKLRFAGDGDDAAALDFLLKDVDLDTSGISDSKLPLSEIGEILRYLHDPTTAPPPRQNEEATPKVAILNQVMVPTPLLQHTTSSIEEPTLGFPTSKIHSARVVSTSSSTFLQSSLDLTQLRAPPQSSDSPVQQAQGQVPSSAVTGALFDPRAHMSRESDGESSSDDDMLQIRSRIKRSAQRYQ